MTFIRRIFPSGRQNNGKIFYSNVSLEKELWEAYDILTCNGAKDCAREIHSEIVEEYTTGKYSCLTSAYRSWIARNLIDFLHDEMDSADY